MKALILAAGYGNRLRPYTETVPKPLFPIDGRPLLDIHIQRLYRAGCRALVVNTHHLHLQIADYLKRQTYPIPVHLSHEPVILGTGGAIKNLVNFWDETPFMVINSDVVTDIDLRSVYDFHCRHTHPVTLVLHDDPQFNSVGIDAAGFVNGFGADADRQTPNKAVLTFTGIQVVDPVVLDDIPAGRFYSSIDAFKKIIKRGQKICAYVNQNHYWQDIGTPDNYHRAVFDHLAPAAFRHGFGVTTSTGIEKKLLQGDGSDRKWYRLKSGNHQMVMVDHGIRSNPGTTEADAFVAIGTHLHRCGAPVPKIYHADTFSGMVFVEDLGDEHLQQAVIRKDSQTATIAIYRQVIGLLIKMAIDGQQNFDPTWTWQTPAYDKKLILDNECRYFMEAFIQGYLNLDVPYETYAAEFEELAEKTLQFGEPAFLHRDFQSRNIMVKNGRIFFIDFQGGRLGPVQYDLASLLIDPYVQLEPDVRQRLFEFAISEVMSVRPVDKTRFKTGFRYCRLTRNLQILGAFAHLSQVKGNTEFESYIPAAIRSLTRLLDSDEGKSLPQLRILVNRIA